jgi:hypothetical protein
VKGTEAKETTKGVVTRAKSKGKLRDTVSRNRHLY